MRAFGKNRGKRSTKPHDLYRHIVCFSSSVARLSSIVRLRSLNNLAASWDIIRSEQRLWLLLLRYRTFRLDPCIVLIGTKALDCNNAGRLVSVKRCAFDLQKELAWLTLLHIRRRRAQILRPVSLAVSLLHSIARRL